MSQPWIALDCQPPHVCKVDDAEPEVKGCRFVEPELDEDDEAAHPQCLSMSETKQRKRSGHKSLPGRHVTRSAVKLESQQMLYRKPWAGDGTDECGDERNDAKGSKVPDSRTQTAGTSTRLHQCGVCEKSFEMSAHLKKHMRQCRHTQGPRCARCLKAFRGCEELLQHVRTQHPERPHGCRLCPATFASVLHLKRHQAIHSGKKPYKLSLIHI